MPDHMVVVGAGLAGTLLAWRLQQLGAVVTLVTAGGEGDATAASGGLVRGFERDPQTRALAGESLDELRDDAWLQAESGFRATGSLYLLDQPDPPLGGWRLLTAAQVSERFGFTGLAPDTVGVWEPTAGHLRPDRLRRAILARLRLAVEVPAARLEGDAVVLRDGRRLFGDRVVLAAGAWTPALLRASGLETSLRTKHIQYSWFSTAPAGLPAFVDETSGLYGRPAEDGRLLLGLPSSRWDIDPHAPPADPQLAAQVVAAAGRRLTRLTAHPDGPPVSAADCYSDPPGLALRPVTGTVHTFTGGSGGAAKTALAASRAAAKALLDQTSLAPVSHGFEEGSR